MKRIANIFILLVAGLIYCNVVCAATFTVPYHYSQSFSGCTSDTNYSSDGWACGTNNTMYNSVNTGSCAGPGGVKLQITNAANYSGGAGGRGWRRYTCGGGYTNDTGNTSLSITSSSEVWIRYYVRFQHGFEWNTGTGMQYMKMIRITPLSPQLFWFDITRDGVTFTSYGAGALGSGSDTAAVSGGGWNELNPSGAMQSNGVRLGDGSWHSIELHLKDQSGNDTYDGQIDYWLDGVLKAHLTGWNFNHGAPQGIARIQWFQNQQLPSNPSGMYADIDDIEVSSTGYIGPLGASLLKPTAPILQIH